MNTITVTYTLFWQLKNNPEYQWTKCVKCFNVKTKKELSKKYQSGCIGYNIKSKFVSLQKLRSQLVKIKSEKTPF